MNKYINAAVRAIGSFLTFVGLVGCGPTENLGPILCTYSDTNGDYVCSEDADAGPIEPFCVTMQPTNNLDALPGCSCTAETGAGGSATGSPTTFACCCVDTPNQN